MKVWISKYALSKGLFEAEGEVVKEIYFSSASGSYHLFTREWHRTRAEAVKAAEKKRDAKIKSIQRQLKKLQQMVF